LHITELRLAGFKSFVDGARAPIEPGLTGVVGPNGCGKSNLLEAVRWVMGAASAKAMRAADMDDVIFAGSAGRPAREHAEVTLVLADALGKAPAPFHTAAASARPIASTAKRCGRRMYNCCSPTQRPAPTRLRSCGKARSAN
jgi:chromosome segregation protein